MTGSLRPLDPAGAATVCSWVPTRTDVVLFGGPRLPAPLTAAALLATPAGHDVLGLWRGDELVGTGQVWQAGDGSVRIGRVLVDPARRGQGLGRELLDALVDHTRHRWPGPATLTLGVYAHNAPALRLYESLGFTVVGEATGVLVDGEVWTSVQMELRVGAEPTVPRPV